MAGACQLAPRWLVLEDVSRTTGSSESSMPRQPRVLPMLLTPFVQVPLVLLGMFFGVKQLCALGLPLAEQFH